MNAKDAIRSTLQTGEFVVNAYVGDLDDADLLVRPVPGMNHIAWQLGHLIIAERGMVEGIRPGTLPPLPEGFEDGHGRQQFGEDDPAKFLPRARYLELMKAQAREADLTRWRPRPRPTSTSPAPSDSRGRRRRRRRVHLAAAPPLMPPAVRRRPPQTTKPVAF